VFFSLFSRFNMGIADLFGGTAAGIFVARYKNETAMAARFPLKVIPVPHNWPRQTQSRQS
jgi:hypothetical protein